MFFPNIFVTNKKIVFPNLSIFFSSSRYIFFKCFSLNLYKYFPGKLGQ